MITLTTDFGHDDPYVGLMKGAILSIAPRAVIVDLCHGVAAHDVVHGALVLASAAGVFPRGTIHVAVIDPGVGTDRAAVAVRTDECLFVGPDNGLFTLALQGVPYKAVRLSNAAYHQPTVSPTFHGRDIFAPVAAHLTAGVALDELGEPASPLVTIDLPRPESRGDTLLAHVLAVDHFGNLITDVTAAQLAEWPGDASRITAGSTTIAGVRRTFADVEEGQPVAYIGSLGRLEIGVRNGHAARQLGLQRGGTITLTTSPLAD